MLKLKTHSGFHDLFLNSIPLETIDMNNINDIFFIYLIVPAWHHITTVLAPWA
jgi:hypothetical protein